MSHVCSSILSCSRLVFSFPLYFLLRLVNTYLKASPFSAHCLLLLLFVLCSFFQCLLHSSLGAKQRQWRQKTPNCLGYFLQSHQELILQCGGKDSAQLTSNYSYACFQIQQSVHCVEREKYLQLQEILPIQLSKKRALPIALCSLYSSVKVLTKGWIFTPLTYCPGIFRATLLPKEAQETAGMVSASF